MTLKETIKSFIMAVCRFPFVWAIIQIPAVREKLQSLPGFKGIYGGGWDRVHPFDRLHGTDTSGFIPSEGLPPSRYDANHRSVYGGSQPGILRAVLAMVPSPETFTFVDLGCGKGRPLLVASEFPFRNIVGVELSPSLVEIARANVAVMEKRYPGRTAVRVEVGDAGTFRFPSGNVVLFLYNPFGKELMTKVVAEMEAALAAEPRFIYVIYYNPVWGACLDASPVLKRHFAARMPYAREERGYGPDAADVVVIWQGGGEMKPMPGADRRIMIANSGARAELAA